MNAPITEVIAVMIPIVAIVMGIGIGMLSLFLDYRKKREMFAMHHKERLTAIDKGMEVPPLPPEFFQDIPPAGCVRRATTCDAAWSCCWSASPSRSRCTTPLRHNYLWGLVPCRDGRREPDLLLHRDPQGVLAAKPLQILPELK